ncbi:LysE/ArgO family amino acid transporter [Streptomyces gardneri]|uniref:LysE/ArgO family amino acid transporter n=1 Tax=Streptomyces gardneri TaxID=66892 RepID=UPI0036C9ACE2
MTTVVVAGLLAGYGIAIPVGAVGAHLVAVAARSPWRTGAGAALGIAAADGVYAVLAVLGGAALVPLLAPVATPLRWVSAAVLVILAAHSTRAAVRAYRAGPRSGEAPPPAPRRAFLTFLGITILNPMTIVYFTALVLGGQTTTGATEATVFVTAAFVASASWQLLLATGGTLLGHLVTGPRGRLTTALASGVLIVALAVGLVV